MMYRRLTLVGLTFVLGFLFQVNQASAARYFFGESPQMVKGCTVTLPIMVDTEGERVLAGDLNLSFDESSVKIDQVDVGGALPMKAFSEVAGNLLRLSAGRFPKSGSFEGVDTMAYLTITPSNDFSLNFSPDLVTDNNLVNEAIKNVLKEASSKSFTVVDRYDMNADGTGGYCTSDFESPTIDFVHPVTGAGGVKADVSPVLVIKDNRSGVDLNSFEVSFNGKGYARYSNGVTINEENGIYRIKINPADDFKAGELVRVEVAVCDSNATRNCSIYPSDFSVETASRAVCGNGVIESSNGEQCDDGNNLSGDGCNVFCAIETTKKVVNTPSCTNGLHDKNEQGIDCGGVCSKACPTCVDGTRNQGEIGIDCGGPCPSCNKTSSGQLITICHTDRTLSTKKSYSLLIPKSQWPVYKLKGDKLGACAIFDLCPQAAINAQPKRKQEAIEVTKTIIKDQGVVNTKKTVVDLPKPELKEGEVSTVSKEVEVVMSQLDLCKTNIDFAEANLDAFSSDIDGDGLSDRLECFANTHPAIVDTDEDGCTDYDELNAYYTDPLDGDDCEVKLDLDRFSEILITDPKPSWVLGTTQPTIAGKLPINAQFAIGVANGAEQNYIDQVSEAIQSVLNLKKDSAPDRIEGAINLYKDSVDGMNDFLSDNEEVFMDEELIALVKQAPIGLNKFKIFEDSFADLLEAFRFDLLKFKTEPITAFAATDFQPTLVGELNALTFEGKSSELRDKTLYDLVITVYLSDGTRMNSKAIRFSVDTATQVSKPRPRTIGSKSIDETTISQIIVGGRAYAQNEEGNFEIEIADQKPTITGETEFGSNVYAIWHSVVLASSVISDSEEGAFEIQSPRDLEMDIPHRVSLYAVKDASGQKIRSESVDVYFRVKKPGLSPLVISTLFALVAIAAVLGGYFFYNKRNANPSY